MLCKEAERVKLEMPLRGCEKSEEAPGCFKKIYKLFKTDTEVFPVNFISTEFKMSKIDMFENCTNPTYFFRPALRSLLTYHIMINIDIRDKKDITKSISQKASKLSEMMTDSTYYNVNVVEECVINFCSCCLCYPKDSDDLGDNTLSKICLAFISAAAVVVYRVTISVDYCVKLSAAECIVVANIVSAVLNAVSILILGKVYDKVALKLTEWENHRTRTNFDDALIIKQFAFSFANSYTSCFYIAFFRGRFGGIFGLSEKYNDHCEGDTCMPQLSFQVLVLMVMKPLPKFAIDIIIPFIKYLWRSMLQCCQSKCCSTKVKNEKTGEQTIEQEGWEVRMKHFLTKEHKKTNLGDFTLGEYTEKIILYGFLMLFAASFPLAPLIAIFIIYIDIHVDAKRLLWLNRRPIAFIAQDIGMWYSMLNFLNIVGVITNGFLISFTSSWAQQYSLVTRLWICILFEHIVFAVKFCIAYLIPDIPKDVRLAIRKEKYEIAKMMDKSNNCLFPERTAKASHDHNALSESLNYADFLGDVKEANVKSHTGKMSYDLPPVLEEEGNITELGPNHQLSHETDLSLHSVTPEGVISAFTCPSMSPKNNNGQSYHTREFIEESDSDADMKLHVNEASMT